MTPRELESRFIDRYYNHKAWFSHFYNEDPNKIDYPQFPYEPKENGTATMHEECFSFSNNIQIQNDVKPAYIVMMPFLAKDLNDKYTKLLENIKLIMEQSFEEKTDQSSKESSRRIAVVIGYNRSVSLDEKINTKFKDYLKKIPKFSEISVNIFGFQWEPDWGGKKTINFGKFKLTEKEKAYKLIKIVNPNAAKKLLTEIEQSVNFKKQIPYQRIRELIKNHYFSERIVNQIRENNHLRPIYLSLLDDDIKKLRTEKIGLFSQYEILIENFQNNNNNQLPHVLTTGYCADDSQSDSVKIVIKYDMIKRKIMASILPLGPYYPEPNVIFLLQFNASLKDYSFIGKGSRLESRRFIQNGLRKALIDPKKIIFSNIGSVSIDVSRLLSKKILNCKIEPTKQMLSALHGISQTHAFPKEWADNLYVALPKVGGPTTETTPLLMKIYTTFDFNSLVTSFPTSIGVSYSAEYFKLWVENFGKYVNFLTKKRKTQEILETDLIEIAKIFYPTKFHRLKERFIKIKNFFQEKLETLENVKIKMKNKGFTASQVDMICQISRLTGIESYKFLSSIFEKNN